MDEHEAEPLHGTPSRQPSASRLLNSAYESASHEASQTEDLNSDGDITGVEQMQEEISTESEQVLSAALQLERICLIEQQNFPDLIFALCYTEAGDSSKQILTVTQREVHKHPHLDLRQECTWQSPEVTTH